MLFVELKNIDGVGEKRAKALLRHFKSIKRISEASIEELRLISEINDNVAENIYKYFNSKV